MSKKLKTTLKKPAKSDVACGKVVEKVCKNASKPVEKSDHMVDKTQAEVENDVKKVGNFGTDSGKPAQKNRHQGEKLVQKFSLTD